mmetsp:Transcript_1551/g.3378  ORF Transcript_1551/g.3378 Transcript_1551/m.3378 type:complete len:94 (+) Transcript_1551:72-353(+)
MVVRSSRMYLMFQEHHHTTSNKKKLDCLVAPRTVVVLTNIPAFHSGSSGSILRLCSDCGEMVITPRLGRCIPGSIPGSHRCVFVGKRARAHTR